MNSEAATKTGINSDLPVILESTNDRPSLRNRQTHTIREAGELLRARPAKHAGALSCHRRCLGPGRWEVGGNPEKPSPQVRLFGMIHGSTKLSMKQFPFLGEIRRLKKM